MRRTSAAEKRLLTGDSMVKLSQIWGLSLGFASAACVIVAQADIDPRTGLQGGGDASPQSFSEFCGAELRRNDARGQALQDEMTKRFYAELERAERALAAGNTAEAADRLTSAEGSIYRGGREDSITSVKCLGEPTARRWFKVSLSVWRAAKGDRRLEISWRRDMQYMLAAPAKPESVASTIEAAPADRFKGSYRAVSDAVEAIEADRNYGAFILREEEQIVANGREVLALLSDFARREAAAALKAEDAAFKRPATEQERQAAQAYRSGSQIGMAMAGVKVDMAELDITTGRQVGESMTQLERADAYGLEPGDRPPLDRRAEQRGDTLLARANDATQALEVRDGRYDLARSYFEFCSCNDKIARAGGAQAKIQPALQAERDRREQQMEAARADLEKKAEAARKGIDDMQKTEAEKKSFKDEADALEAELGF